MRTIHIVMFLAFFTLLAPECKADSINIPSDTSEQKNTLNENLPTNTSNQNPPEAPKKKNFRLEAGGSYSWLTDDYGQWKSLDLSLSYSGLERIKPSVSIATLSRKEGSQLVYGAGSYIIFNPKFYMVAGISGAPVKDPDVILYPRLRLDLGGFFSAPIIEGLVLTTGITHFPEQNDGGGEIISLGAIYYGKIILMGSLSYNIARPGNVTSWAGNGGFMYGQQGKYWAGGNISIGRVAYQLASDIPFDVRYDSRGANLFYSRWLGKDWGVTTRLDYHDLVGAYNLIGITMKVFIEF